MTPKYYSQFQQDKVLNETVFLNKRNGYFIDVGAFDGVSLSDSYFFETQLDWDGICIEPHSTAYADLVKNRKCKTFNCCAFNKDCKVEFNEIDGYSIMLSGIVEEYNDAHVNRILGEKKSNSTVKLNKTYKDARTLESIMDEAKAPSFIDYLKIDTEGGELKILESVNFDKRSFAILQIEVNYVDDDLYKLNSFLTSKGYQSFGNQGCDYFWKNKTL